MGTDVRKQSDKPQTAGGSVKFGTFTGVFVPNVLTILGVILFMRVGWVVGEAGLVNALIILLIANTVTFMTSLSLSAIATNAKVGGGGAYFMISRSLGLEIGGSIGVPLFLAQAVSVAFYSIGFSESLQVFFPYVSTQLLAVGVIVILFLIAWKSSSIAFKTQNAIFFILLLSLGSFFFGAFGNETDHLAENRLSVFSEGNGFWQVFAIFFPAVTGVMAGASMSGDLKNPGRSIPRGTLLSVALTFLVYAVQIFWLARYADRETLLDDPLVMRSVAAAPSLIYVGLWAATLSSALASLLAAPRTLQALANDGVMPRFLGRSDKQTQEPRIGLIVSLVIALACTAIGKLDLIAPVISMFFLATYGMLNGVAFLERIVANPSYRPSFNPHWTFSLVGALGCLAIMFLLNVWATIASIVTIGFFYLFLLQRSYETTWGDMRSGFWFSITRLGMLRFAESQKHIRNWRPVILVLSGNPKTRLKMVEFAHWMEAGRGFLFLAQIIVGEREKVLPRLEAAKLAMDDFIEENELSAVAQVMTAESFDEGSMHLLQVSGVGPIIPNTVIVGWNEDLDKRERFRSLIDSILLSKKNLLLFIEAEQDYITHLDKTIDVWWRSRRNGILMVTLAHLLCSNSPWRRHRIRLIMVVEDIEVKSEVEGNIRAILNEIRIHAEVCIFEQTGSIRDMIISHSKLSEVCFMGVDLNAESEGTASIANLDAIAKAFHGNVLIAKSWEDLNANWK